MNIRNAMQYLAYILGASNFRRLEGVKENILPKQQRVCMCCFVLFLVTTVFPAGHVIPNEKVKSNLLIQLSLKIGLTYHTVPACRAEETVMALSRSLVKIPADKPQKVLFALLITSSKDLNFMICCTGPNIYTQEMNEINQSNRLRQVF